MAETKAQPKKTFSPTQYRALVPKGQNPEVYLKLVKEQIMGDKLTTEDFNLFLYTCSRTGLDPLTNQIYAVPRWDSNLGRNKMSIQTGIDGFRLIAQRTGQYLGQDDIKFSPEDESSKYPIKATCTVKKVLKGEVADVTATARWNEYVQTKKTGEPMAMWAKMPYTMLGKCAEALALRKAFPNELSGIYTTEEMGQASNGISDLPTPERFEKKEEVKVEHGAPVEATAIKTPAPAKDVGAMRNKLNKESTDASKTKDEEKGKTAKS